MKKVILIFLFILLVCVSLSYSIKTITVGETDLVLLKPKASDEDADRLFYTFTEPLDSEGKWQTTYGDAGEYTVTITVSDGELSTSQDVVLSVKKENAEPSIDSFSPKEGDITINEGDELKFNVVTSDLNKDALSYRWLLDGNVVSEKEDYSYKTDFDSQGTYKLSAIVSDGEAEDQNEWIVNVKDFDRSTLLDSIKGVTVNEGKVLKLELPDFKKYNLDYSLSAPLGDDNYWETTYADAGRYAVEINIKDREFTASKTIDVEVKDLDRPFVFKDIENVFMEENQKVTIDLEVYDPDNDLIEVYAEGLPDGASLKEKRFEWIPGYDTVTKEGGVERVLAKFHLLYKPFRVAFVAKSKGIEVRRSLLIMVKDVNRAPVFEDMPTITVNEGEEMVIEPKASDPDDDEITYSYSGWLATNRYMTNFEDAGTYKVKIEAWDGFLKTEKFVIIEVINTNRPPNLKNIPSSIVSEGEEVVVQIEASDPDGDFINFSSGALPENATFENGLFRWVPSYDTVRDDSGIVVVDFIASDSLARVSNQVNITVLNVNRAPKMTAAGPKKEISVKKNERIIFRIEAEDPDGDELKYTWRFDLFDKYEGNPTIARTFTTPGTKKVKVIASDGELQDEYEWIVKVV